LTLRQDFAGCACGAYQRAQLSATNFTAPVASLYPPSKRIADFSEIGSLLRGSIRPTTYVHWRSVSRGFIDSPPLEFFIEKGVVILTARKEIENLNILLVKSSGGGKPIDASSGLRWMRLRRISKSSALRHQNLHIVVFLANPDSERFENLKNKFSRTIRISLDVTLTAWHINVLNFVPKIAWGFLPK
jgi:hypothetical protein